MPNNKVQNNKISNININELGSSKYTYINKTGYCSKCLVELGIDRVVDAEDNEFCCSECRSDYWRENRLEFDSVFREWARKY